MRDKRTPKDVCGEATLLTMCEHSFNLEYLGVLSIQQKFRFKIWEIPRAQSNGTFRLHRPDPSPRAFG